MAPLPEWEQNAPVKGRMGKELHGTESQRHPEQTQLPQPQPSAAAPRTAGSSPVVLVLRSPPRQEKVNSQNKSLSTWAGWHTPPGVSES